MARGGKRPRAGRKRGAVTKRSAAAANKLVQSGALPLEILVESMRTAWTDGEMDKACALARDVAPYFHARVSPKDAPVKLEGLNGTLSEKSEVVLSAMASGEITPEEATRIMQAVVAQARIVEVNELERRVAALETQHGQP